MDPHIPRVVPHMLRLDLEREVMCRFLPMLFGVAAFVPSAAGVAADEADPEILGAITYPTEGSVSSSKWRVGGVVGICVWVVLGLC